MKLRWLAITLLILFISFDSAKSNLPWGFFAHMQINRMAVFTLPPEMLGFYKRNIDYITKHAVDPDKLRYLIAEEAPRHYIDLDLYPELLAQPSLPKWSEAVSCYTIDSLNSKGVLPWNLERVMNQLTKAFVARDSNAILRYSAYLGHYLADACVPLHTSSNYNGQLTNQKGIHAFWETRLPVLFISDYDQIVGRAVYVDLTFDYGWKLIRQSHAAVDSVLKFETLLNANTPPEQKFALVEKNGSMVNDYSEHYAQKYHAQLDGMVERRMQAAIYSIGSYWFTAWVNAGKPSLDNWSRIASSLQRDSVETAVDKMKIRIEE